MSEFGSHAGSNKRGSVTRRFNVILFLFYLVSILVAAPVVYWVTERQVYEQADRELAVLVDMVRSIQGYVAKNLRPFLIEKGLFHSPGFSGIVATSLVAENFKKLQPGYYIKNSSDNPLNPQNSPQPLEDELLRKFRNNRSLDGATEVGLLNGNAMLVSAAPKLSAKGCLKCHGEPDKAPAEITGQYGTTSGYNYKLDDVVGVSVVGVPLGDVRALALERSVIVVVMLTALFAVIFIAINVMVKRSLLAPILEIAQTAKDISQGRMETPVEVSRNDEIGDLSQAIELLRRSFLAAMKRLRAK